MDKLALICPAAHMDFEAVFQAFERLGGADVRAVVENHWLRPTPQARAVYRENCVPFYQMRKSENVDRQARMNWDDATALHFDGPQYVHGLMDFRDVRAQITCPVPVMVGHENPITTPQFVDAIDAGQRRTMASCLCIAGCGRGAVGDRPNEALSGLRDFIDQGNSATQGTCEDC